LLCLCDEALDVTIHSSADRFKRLSPRSRLAVVLALVVVAATMGLTNGAPGPGWLRWALQGVLALVVVFSWLTLLFDPLSRSLAGESRHRRLVHGGVRGHG
jgi:hypothetical protein